MKHILIGDTHGNKYLLSSGISKIKNLRKSSRDSLLIHLGDFGFKEDWIYGENFSDILRVVPGNHEDYDYILSPDYNGSIKLPGRFGIFPHTDMLKVFYISGAYSIDKFDRLLYHENNPGKEKSWWHQEQLTHEEMIECRRQYLEFQPDVVISHACPSTVSSYMNYYNLKEYEDDVTQPFLNSLWSSYPPKYWYFGHHHVSIYLEDFYGSGTNFRCLNISETLVVNW